MRLLVLASTCLLTTGCLGPLTAPMIQRLGDREQRAVDETWNNIFDSAAPLDRTMLLDVMVAGGLYQFGVDRLEMTSEKRLRRGLVRMEVRFDRDRPSGDQFAITYLDTGGHPVRTERYTRSEVEQRIFYLTNTEAPCNIEQPADDMLTEAEWRAKQRKVRLRKIEEILEPIKQLDDARNDEADAGTSSSRVISVGLEQPQNK